MRILTIWAFASISENGALDIIFQKNNTENLKKLEIAVNIFVFFIKTSCQCKESTLSKQSPFSLTPSFLEMFHPHPYCQIKGSQSPLCKWGMFELFYLFSKQLLLSLYIIENLIVTVIT